MTYAKIAGLMLGAIKINDTAIYSLALFEVTSMFFMPNHHKYARWMSLYSSDLANLETSQPNLQEILTGRGFSVNRAGKLFSSIPIDMALEQTTNANAKNNLKGIMALADISTAGNQWMVTASMKSKTLNAVLDYADMNISYYELKELCAFARQPLLPWLARILKEKINQKT